MIWIQHAFYHINFQYPLDIRYIGTRLDICSNCLKECRKKTFQVCLEKDRLSLNDWLPDWTLIHDPSTKNNLQTESIWYFKNHLLSIICHGSFHNWYAIVSLMPRPLKLRLTSRFDLDDWQVIRTWWFCSSDIIIITTTYIKHFDDEDILETEYDNFRIPQWSTVFCFCCLYHWIVTTVLWISLK